MSDPDLPAGVSQREIDGPPDAEPTFVQNAMAMNERMVRFLIAFANEEAQDLVCGLAQCAFVGPNQKLAFVNEWLGEMEQRWESRRQPVATPDVEEPEPFEQF